MKKLLLTLITIMAISTFISAQDIKLPEPEKNIGKPLMQALNERKSSREFSNKELSLQQLSNLLWAANGFNREDKRTAPTRPKLPRTRALCRSKRGHLFL